MLLFVVCKMMMSEVYPPHDEGLPENKLSLNYEVLNTRYSVQPLACVYM